MGSAEANKKWRDENREKWLESARRANKKWRKINKDKYNESARKANKKWRDKNREKYNELCRTYNQKWKKENPEKHKEITLKWRAKNFFAWITVVTRGRSKRKKKEHTITKEYLEQLWIKQKGLCALTGIKLTQSLSKRDPFLGSLDRIDNSKGYIKGNVRWVCLAVNVALGPWGALTFAIIATAYVDKLGT